MAKPVNEIEAAARDHKRGQDAAKSGASKTNWPIVPIAIGVGSAAVAAAVLYAGRGRRK